MGARPAKCITVDRSGGFWGLFATNLTFVCPDLSVKSEASTVCRRANIIIQQQNMRVMTMW